MSELELRFKIDKFLPETIPMERLGEYLVALAKMLGDKAEVHFKELETGSTVVVHRVAEKAAVEVEERITHVARGTADLVHLNAFKELNALLKADDATGVLTREGGGGKLLSFPGKHTLEPARPQVVTQASTIDGVVIKLGGKDDTVPVTIQDGENVYICNTTRAIARTLGPHLFGRELRLSGKGEWHRPESGTWVLRKFYIADFIELDDTPLPDLVETLRQSPGTWGEGSDAWDELRELRGGEEDER
jgi:hypothetical protein